MGSIFTFFAGTCSPSLFLGLKPWYYYLNVQPVTDPLTKATVCQVQNFQLIGTHSDLLLIILVIVDDLLMVAGLVAVFFVIYAGIRYITSQGSPDVTAKAQSTIIYALIGLAIAVIAVPTVSYLGNRFATGNGGSTGIAGGSLNLSSLPNATGAANGSILQTVLQDLFGVIGGLALIFLIIGGLRYIFSNGDPQNAASARGTIIYALVGLMVAIVAESIVALVLGKLK
jgi:hypothetical protein